MAEGSPRAPVPVRPFDVATTASDSSATLLEHYKAAHASSKAYAAGARTRLSDNRNIANFSLTYKEACHPIVARHARKADAASASDRDGSASSSSGSCRVVDADGNEVIDMACGFGAVLFGHNPPFVREAVLEMIRANACALGFEHPIAERNAEKVCCLTGFDRCAFMTTGSEATALACRLCRAHTGRAKIVTFEGSYHGHFDGFLGRPVDASAPDACFPVSPGIPEAYTRDLIVLPFDDEASLDFLEARHAEIGGVFCEPVQNRRPCVVAAPFLHRLRELTRRRGIVLVFDEVVTGFRVAAGGAQQALGVRCDLACYGKALGGGYPVGCLAGARDLMDLADGGGGGDVGGGGGRPRRGSHHAGTFDKHPLVMAATSAVLDHILARGDVLFEELNQLAASLAATLNAWWRERGYELHLDHFCSMLRFIVPASAAMAFFQTLNLHGVYCWEGRTCFLTTAHTPRDVELIVAACQETTRQLLEHGISLASPSLQPSL